MNKVNEEIKQSFDFRAENLVKYKNYNNSVENYKKSIKTIANNVCDIVTSNAENLIQNRMDRYGFLLVNMKEKEVHRKNRNRNVFIISEHLWRLKIHSILLVKLKSPPSSSKHPEEKMFQIYNFFIVPLRGTH